MLCECVLEPRDRTATLDAAQALGIEVASVEGMTLEPVDDGERELRGRGGHPPSRGGGRHDPAAGSSFGEHGAGLRAAVARLFRCRPPRELEGATRTPAAGLRAARDRGERGVA
jgi:hypothetical protein